MPETFQVRHLIALFERLALHELGHQVVRVVLRPTDLVQRDDARMLELRGAPRFTQEPLVVVLGREVADTRHLDGHYSIELDGAAPRSIALNVDARGVIRHRVDRDPRPEFVDGDRSTNTSGGALLTFGGTFYF